MGSGLTAQSVWSASSPRRFALWRKPKRRGLAALHTLRAADEYARRKRYSTTVVVFSAALRCACNAHVSPALDVSVAIGTTLRPVPAQDSLSIPTTRLGDALPALLEV